MFNHYSLHMITSLLHFFIKSSETQYADIDVS